MELENGDSSIMVGYTLSDSSDHLSLFEQLHVKKNSKYDAKYYNNYNQGK